MMIFGGQYSHRRDISGYTEGEIGDLSIDCGSLPVPLTRPDATNVLSEIA